MDSTTILQLMALHQGQTQQALASAAQLQSYVTGDPYPTSVQAAGGPLPSGTVLDPRIPYPSMHGMPSPVTWGAQTDPRFPGSTGFNMGQGLTQTAAAIPGLALSTASFGGLMSMFTAGVGGSPLQAFSPISAGVAGFQHGLGQSVSRVAAGMGLQANLGSMGIMGRANFLMANASPAAMGGGLVRGMASAGMMGLASYAGISLARTGIQRYVLDPIRQLDEVEGTMARGSALGAFPQRGGMGFSRAESGRVAGIFSSMALEGAQSNDTLENVGFSRFGQVQSFAATGMRMGMFQGTQSVEGFERKIRELAKNAKKMARLMNVTLEEGLGLIKESGQLGAYTPADAVAMQTDLSAMRRGGGLSQQGGARMAMTGATLIGGMGGSRSDAVRAGVAAGAGINAGMMRGQLPTEMLRDMYGGVGREEAANLLMQRSYRGAQYGLRGTMGRLFTLGLRSGGEIDEDALEALANGSMTSSDLMRGSRKNLRGKGMAGVAEARLFRGETMAGLFQRVNPMQMAYMATEARYGRTAMWDDPTTRQYLISRTTGVTAREAGVIQEFGAPGGAGAALNLGQSLGQITRTTDVNKYQVDGVGEAVGLMVRRRYHQTFGQVEKQVKSSVQGMRNRIIDWAEGELRRGGFADTLGVGSTTSVSPEVAQAFGAMAIGATSTAQEMLGPGADVALGGGGGDSFTMPGAAGTPWGGVAAGGLMGAHQANRMTGGAIARVGTRVSNLATMGGRALALGEWGALRRPWATAGAYDEVQDAMRALRGPTSPLSAMQNVGRRAMEGLRAIPGGQIVGHAISGLGRGTVGAGRALAGMPLRAAGWTGRAAFHALGPAAWAVDAGYVGYSAYDEMMERGQWEGYGRAAVEGGIRGMAGLVGYSGDDTAAMRGWAGRIHRSGGFDDLSQRSREYRSLMGAFPGAMPQSHQLAQMVASAVSPGPTLALGEAVLRGRGLTAAAGSFALPGTMYNHGGVGAAPRLAMDAAGDAYDAFQGLSAGARGHLLYKAYGDGLGASFGSEDYNAGEEFFSTWKRGAVRQLTVPARIRRQATAALALLPQGVLQTRAAAGIEKAITTANKGDAASSVLSSFNALVKAPSLHRDPGFQRRLGDAADVYVRGLDSESARGLADSLWPGESLNKERFVNSAPGIRKDMLKGELGSFAAGLGTAKQLGEVRNRLLGDTVDEYTAGWQKFQSNFMRMGLTGDVRDVVESFSKGVGGNDNIEGFYNRFSGGTLRDISTDLTKSLIDVDPFEAGIALRTLGASAEASGVKGIEAAIGLSKAQYSRYQRITRGGKQKDVAFNTFFRRMFGDTQVFGELMRSEHSAEAKDWLRDPRKSPMPDAVGQMLRGTWSDLNAEDFQKRIDTITQIGADNRVKDDELTDAATGFTTPGLMKSFKGLAGLVATAAGGSAEATEAVKDGNKLLTDIRDALLDANAGQSRPRKTP